MALAASTFALQAAAQVPAATPAARAGCTDLLVAGAEYYDFSGGGHGHGVSVDGVRCMEGAWSVLGGASTYDVAGSRWSIARLGATARWPAGHVAYFTATGGSGRNEGGHFPYRKLSGGASLKAGDALYAKVEHEYFDVDENRGHIGKLGVVAVPAPGLAIDVTAARSIGGNLPTRAVIARADFATPAVRFFGGLAHGRLLPQVRDIASGERAPDVVSREAFAGVALRLPLGELIAAVDIVRTAGSRRNTYALAWQVPLP